MNELQWRAWCWYTGLGRREYLGPEGTKLWMRYYEEFLYMKNDEDRQRRMLELCA